MRPVTVTDDRRLMGAADWDERYESGRLWSREPNRFFVEAVGDWKPGRAVDLACGEGRNALWLAQGGWSVTAVDFSSVAVERGRAVAAELGVDVEWVVADLEAWDLGEQVWDLVAHVYLHWAAQARQPFLDRCAAAVAPGGRAGRGRPRPDQHRTRSRRAAGSVAADNGRGAG